MNEKQPCIHIVIPVYNPPEKYFRDCLRSISAQAHENFSCILVDDGSQAETAAICDEAAARDPRFVVIHKENRGTAHARCVGVLAALEDGAKFIAFMDNDDTVAPDYLSKMIAYLLDTDADACFCGVNKVRDGAVFETSFSPSKTGICEDRRGMLLAACNSPPDGWKFGNMCVVWAGIFRAGLFNGMNWEFNDKKIVDDALMSCQLLFKMRRAAFLSDRLYDHLQHPASALHLENQIGRYRAFNEWKYGMADFLKTRMPEFDFAPHAASSVMRDWFSLLSGLLGSGMKGVSSDEDIAECARHIRQAAKIPGATALILGKLPRSQRLGLRVFILAGLPAYRLYNRLLGKWRCLKKRWKA